MEPRQEEKDVREASGRKCSVIQNAGDVSWVAKAATRFWEEGTSCAKYCPQLTRPLQGISSSRSLQGTSKEVQEEGWRGGTAESQGHLAR